MRGAACRCADKVIDLALIVFAPRPANEVSRVLATDGALLVVVPGAGHLRGLVEELPEDLGLLRIDPIKQDRLEASLGGTMRRLDEVAVHEMVPVSRDIAEALILMGPHAFHVDADRLREQIAALPEPISVTVEATVTTWVRASPERRSQDRQPRPRRLAEGGSCPRVLLIFVRGSCRRRRLLFVA